MARDNFPKKTTEALKQRVAYRCSNPECRVPTIGPGSEDIKSNSIGIAAHISGASPGGPRYSSSMSQADRISFENGLWLCANCSIKIDKDVQHYTVELLKEWKASAEQAANQELGKKLITKNEIQDTLAAVLGGNPKKLIPDAIANIHEVSSDLLESLDPRFKVITSYNEGISRFEIHAKENATIQMKINGESAQEYEKKFSRLEELGEDLTIKSDEISFEGSRLFAEILSNQKGGTFKISAPKKPSVVKVWTKPSKGGENEYFEDFIGHISFGKNQGSFLGYCCNKMVELKIDRLAPQTPKFNLSISVDVTSWAGKDLRHLPYSTKIFNLFENLANGDEVSTGMEIEGARVMTSSGISLKHEISIRDFNTYFQYTKAARTIASFLNLSIPFSSELPISKDEFVTIMEVARIINGLEVFSAKDFNKNVTFNLECDENMLILNLTNNHSNELKLIQNVENKLLVFGTPVELPPLNWIFTSAKLKLTSISQDIKPGDLLSFEVIPTDEFQLQKTFTQN